jgi:hypothetical protein
VIRVPHVPIGVPASHTPPERSVVRGDARVAGLVVLTPGGEPVAYLLGEPRTQYGRVMTRAEWMPVLVGEVI